MKRRAIDDKVVIRYFAIPNPNTTKGGFLPMIEQNGRLRGHRVGPGWDREDAELQAKSEALEAASRYTGDWRITVRAADAKYAAAAMARDEHHWKKVRGR